MTCFRCHKPIDPDTEEWAAFRGQCDKCEAWFSASFHVACLQEYITSTVPDILPEHTWTPRLTRCED